MINILFSGIDKENGFNKEQEKCLKQDIKCNQNITFISSSFDKYENSIKYMNSLINCFNKIGITFNKVNLIDSRITINEAHNIVENSDIVFLLGGDVKEQIENINKYNLKSYIDNVHIVLGVSAGSMNQCDRIVFENEDVKRTIIDYKGLGYFNMSIYPHLDLNNKKYLEEAFRVSKIVPIIAIPNDSFIRLENDIVKYYGDYYYIDNGEIIKK